MSVSNGETGEEAADLLKLLCRNCEDWILIDRVEQHAHECSIMLPTNQKKAESTTPKQSKHHHIIEKMSDFPESVHKVLAKASLDEALCAQHLHVLCSVLNFTTRLKFTHRPPPSALHHTAMMLQSAWIAPYAFSPRHVVHVDRWIAECARALALRTQPGEADMVQRAARGETDAGFWEVRLLEKERIKMQQESLFREAMTMCDTKTEREVSSLYSLGQELGKGGFGVVFVADTRRRTLLPRHCAIKKMTHSEREVRMKRSNLRELFYLKQLDHPNVVKYIRCHYVAKKELWLVLEYLEGGSLRRASELSVFSETEVAYVAREILQAVAYIHSLGLVHRDIKSHNVMLSVEGHVKLIDFGLVADVNRGISTMRGILGTAFWIPPEMVQGKSHSFPADIWSSAICLLELCNGHPPNHKSKIRALFLIGAGYAPTLEKPAWSPSCHRFFDKMLQIDPENRATAADLLLEPYLKSAAPISSMQNRLVNLFQVQALQYLF